MEVIAPRPFSLNSWTISAQHDSGDLHWWVKRIYDQFHSKESKLKGMLADGTPIVAFELFFNLKIS